MPTKSSLSLLIFLGFNLVAFGQSMTSSEILHELQKLKKVGSVLFVAAHPDDENTTLLSYLAQEEKLDTAYLSLTRGGGGQNLIGSELNQELGLIRANELLQARRIDGAIQLFTRARDFGYSKNPEDTLENWEEDEVLGDVVYAVRQFRPDVIITRFNPAAGPTHGHHTVSAQLALKAFSLAADPHAFTEQLSELETHQAKRILWNGFGQRRRGGGGPSPASLEDESREVVSLEVGLYNPYLGTSYTELSAKSRSMHKSQGFGRAGQRGSQFERMVLLAGEPTEGDFLKGVETSWRRYSGSSQLDSLFESAIGDFDAAAPWKSVRALLEIDALLEKLSVDRQIRSKRSSLQRLVAACMGLHLQARVPQADLTPGESVKLDVEFINRSPIEARVVNLEANLFESSRWPEEISLTRKEDLDKELDSNAVEFVSLNVNLPIDSPLTRPYWLEDEASVGIYSLRNRRLLELESIPSSLSVSAVVEIQGRPVTLNVPVVQVVSDPVKGEVHEQVVIRPEVTLSPENSILLFENSQAKEIEVLVQSNVEAVVGKLTAEGPQGWKISITQPEFELEDVQSSQRIRVQLTPPATASEGKIVFKVINESGKEFDSSYREIFYEHIGRQPILNRAVTKVTRLDLGRGGSRIACIEGVGDTVPDTLSKIGYEVDIVLIGELEKGRLDSYDTVILGPRVFDAYAGLDKRFDVLLNYVENGGTLVSQYSTTSFRAKSRFTSPYPIRLSRDRVSEEKAEMRLLQPDHVVFNYPNKITKVDFDNWIQERGLYYASSWDDHYDALISANDRGEPPRDGGLLVTEYGKGWYVYTGLSFFRQLPNGNPGAIRLFVNLISLGHGD